MSSAFANKISNERLLEENSSMLMSPKTGQRLSHERKVSASVQPGSSLSFVLSPKSHESSVSAHENHNFHGMGVKELKEEV
jgi:hypothetical protein